MDAAPTTSPNFTQYPRYFSLFDNFVQFYRKYMPFRCDTGCEYGEERAREKAESNPGPSRQKITV